MTEASIQKQLSWFMNLDKFPYQLANAFVYSWESDYWACTSGGETREYEIKISRADFKKDALKDKHSKEGGANYFYYVCPRGLIQPEEIKKEYGLIWVSDEHPNYGCEIKKKPKKLHSNRFNNWQQMAEKYFWRWWALWKKEYKDGNINRDQYREALTA